jgi:2-polyprenyl-3-methyl-5-hydroxy-6-metoxy-1,4-benzoquinol methylase
MFKPKYYDAPNLHELAFVFPPQSIWRGQAFSAILGELSSGVYVAKTLLDVGCGTGVLPKMIALKFSNLSVKAIDSSSHMIRYARRVHPHPSIDYEAMSFWDEKGTYDRVTSTYSWYFFPPDEAARKLRSVLNPGGNAFIVATKGTVFTRIHRRILKSISGQDLCHPDKISRSLEKEGFSTAWRMVNRTEGSFLVVAELA